MASGSRRGTGYAGQGLCLRRVGLPALRPGSGLRRPGPSGPGPGRLWDAGPSPARPTRTEGHQTGSTRSRSYVRWGAPPGPGGPGPVGETCATGSTASPNGCVESRSFAQSPVSDPYSSNGNGIVSPTRGCIRSSLSIKSLQSRLNFIIATTEPRCSRSFG